MSEKRQLKRRGQVEHRSPQSTERRCFRLTRTGIAHDVFAGGKHAVDGDGQRQFDGPDFTIPSQDGCSEIIVRTVAGCHGFDEEIPLHEVREHAQGFSWRVA